MSTIDDLRYAFLGLSGFTGARNDREAAYLSDTGARLRDALTSAAKGEREKPSTLHFTVYDEAAVITTHDWFTSTTATHTDLDDAIQHCIDNLTTGRTAYESIRINLGGTLNEQVVISDDWTELVFSGETITAATGLNEYMFFADDISHLKVLGAKLDNDYANQSSTSGGFQVEHSDHVYFGNCVVDNARNESFELGTCTNSYFENCIAYDFGDDGFSILNSSLILIKDSYCADARISGLGASGCFELEDGSFNCVLDGCRTFNSAEEGIHIITDGPTTKTLSSISEIGGGIYRANSSAVTAFGIGKPVSVYTLSGSGDHDGLWTITNVDFTGGTWFEFDMGAANAGLGAGSPGSDRAKFNHNPCHDIYIYNHELDTCAGKGVTITSNAKFFLDDGSGDEGLFQTSYNIFIDGLKVRDVVEEGISFSYARDCVVRNLDLVGLPAGRYYGVNMANSKGLVFYDCQVSHTGDNGFRAYRTVNVGLYRCKANDVSENTASTNGYGFNLDADLWDFDLQTRTAAADQDAGYVVQDCESLKVNWGGTGSADMQGGLQLQDSSGALVDNCAFTAHSGSSIVKFTLGATSENNTVNDIIGFTQP